MIQSEGRTVGRLSDLVGYHLRRASTIVRKDFERTLGDMGLRQVTIAVLTVIEANPGINQGEAGRILDIKRPNMVSLMTDLVQAGWVGRAEDPADRRALTLTLTAKGRDMLARAHERVREHEDALLRDLSPVEQRQLIGLLRRIGNADRDG